MFFHVTRRLEAQAAALVYLPNECLWCGLARTGLAEGGLGSGRFGSNLFLVSYHGVNRVPVPYGIGKPL